MKERPIPFSAPMVLAILAGTKTQTRRAVKPTVPESHEIYKGDSGRFWINRVDQAHNCDRQIEVSCPYGQPGDRLWVREPWRTEARYDHLSPAALPADARIWYMADGEPAEPGAGRYRHARFMPKRLARIWLENAGVRVERLCDISEQDALEEGITYNDIPNNGLDPMRARTWFRGLWESINGPGSWDANPWVWVVEFAPLAPVGR